MTDPPPGNDPARVVVTQAPPPNGTNGARRPISPPHFSIGEPLGASWREQTLARIAEQRALTTCAASQSELDPDAAEYYSRAIDLHLDAAKQAAESPTRLKLAISGAAVERALSNLDVVESHLLRLAPPSYLRSQMASTLAHVRRHLDDTDPRRVDVEALAKSDRQWGETEASAVITAVHAASSKARAEHRQLRSFRNVLWATSFVLTLLACAVLVIGIVDPTVLPLCFTPNGKSVCPVGNTPSGWDIPLIELLGLTAAALAAAVSLRNIKGTATPYRIPLALAVLKLPSGALTALLGILLVRGAFVPGLSDLDTSAQILSWAVVLGYSQQLLTQFVDRQGQSVLENVRPGGTGPGAGEAVQPTAAMQEAT